MDKLKSLQNIMAEAYRRLSTTEFEQAQCFIKPTAKLDARAQLNIYHDSINAALISTLKSTFPVCLALVGDEFFSALCYRYVAKTPSTSPDLNDYGADFAQFLAQFEPVKAVPYLPDMAGLEWCWHRLLFAQANLPADLSMLLDKSEQELASVVLSIVTQAKFVQSNYPLQAIWEMCVEQSLSNGNEDGPSLDVDSGGVRLILYRDHNGRQMDLLTEAEYFLLQQIAGGQSLAELMRHYFEQGFVDTFEQVLTQCARQGWLAGVGNAVFSVN